MSFELREISLAHAIAQVVTETIAQEMSEQSLPSISVVERRVAPDEILSAGSASVRFDKLMECSFAIPDVTLILRDPELCRIYCRPAVLAMSEAMRDHGDHLIVARPPNFIEHSPHFCGSFSEVAEVPGQRFPIRLTMGYDTSTLQQLFIFRMFYGVPKWNNSRTEFASERCSSRTSRLLGPRSQVPTLTLGSSSSGESSIFSS